jgi:hypothetical protein
MKPYRYILLGLGAVLMLGMLLLGAAGCGGPRSDYTPVTTAFSGANITYEYPKTYEMPPGGPGDNSITYLRYVDSANATSQYVADRMIFIETQPLDPDTGAAALMDQDIGTIMQNGLNFQLVKRTTTRVAGIGAELLAFTMDFPSSPLTDETATTWVAYFEHGDNIWEIGVMANASLGDAAETDFKHLVASFSFK